MKAYQTPPFDPDPKLASRLGVARPKISRLWGTLEPNVRTPETAVPPVSAGAPQSREGWIQRRTPFRSKVNVASTPSDSL